MRTFECQCGHTLYFPNTQCMHCGRAAGYVIEADAMTSLEPADNGLWHVPTSGRVSGRVFRKCVNYEEHAVCNWLVPDDSPHRLCESCRLTRIIPDLSQPRHKLLWSRLEAAKRQMLYGLRRLNLPIVNRHEDPAHGLAIDFLADTDAATEFTEPLAGKPRVNTGHENGVITINIAEADDVARTRMRELMGEDYRTLLGHFRHEVGHYYWARLVADSEWLSRFREVFGDERADYQDALNRHYSQGPPNDWQAHYISRYASMHPWEDWAESWGHYMMMIDTLETAEEFQFLDPPHWARSADPFDILMRAWTSFTLGINAVNRSMGLGDPYPFVLGAIAYKKLRFVHEVVQQAGQQTLPFSLPERAHRLARQ